jgi:hypothetical protein
MYSRGCNRGFCLTCNAEKNGSDVKGNVSVLKALVFKRIHLSPVSLVVLLLFKVGEVVIHKQVGSLTLAHRILAEIPPD